MCGLMSAIRALERVNRHEMLVDYAGHLRLFRRDKRVDLGAERRIGAVDYTGDDDDDRHHDPALAVDLSQGVPEVEPGCGQAATACLPRFTAELDRPRPPGSAESVPPARLDLFGGHERVAAAAAELPVLGVAFTAVSADRVAGLQAPARGGLWSGERPGPGDL